MNSHSMTTFGWLVKREYWESRGGFLWAQFWGAATLAILSILIIVLAEVMRLRMINGSSDVHFSVGFLQSVSSHDLEQLGKVMDLVVLLFGGIAAVILSFVIFFYLLGALYDDRKDRSILFWKSLPLSDSSTVISKTIAAIFVAPVIAVFVVLAGFIVEQVILSLWILAHGANPFTLIWAHIEPYSVWFHLLVMIGVNAIWALPTVGWLLLWSAAVRSKPFLWAIIIPVIAGVLNFFVGLLGLPNVDNGFLWWRVLARLLLSVAPGWILDLGTQFSHPDDLGKISYAAMGDAFALPQMWIGAAVGIVLIAAAIWFRRWRDEA